MHRMELPGRELPGMELSGMELPGRELPGMELPGGPVDVVGRAMDKAAFSALEDVGVVFEVFVVLLVADVVPLLCAICCV